MTSTCRDSVGRTTIAITAGLGLLILAGCTSAPPREPVFPVKGQLFVDDKPAKGAVVWFYAADAAEADVSNPAAEPQPTAIVDEDGSFELSTYGVKDGAPAGRYRVGVMWVKSAAGDTEGERLLPAEYLDPNKAGLPVVEIRPEPINVLPPFNLSR